MKKTRANTVLLGLCALTLVLVTAHLALKYVSVQIYHEQHGFLFELSNRFDLNDEASVPQWFTQAIFIGIAASAFLAARVTGPKRARKLWYAVALIGLLLSLDDVATLHEFVLQTLHNTFFLDTAPTFTKNSWFVLLPFVLAGLLWLLLNMIRNFPRGTVALFAFSSVVYICGAVIVDSFANTVAPRDFMNQGVLSAIEGGMQLLGSSLFLYAVIRHLEQHHVSQLRAAARELSPRKS